MCDLSVPPVFSDELYELTGAVILDNGSRFSSSHTRQVLLLFAADGNYEVPVNMQLIDERLRNFGFWGSEQRFYRIVLLE